MSRSSRQLAVITVAFALLVAGCGPTTPRANAAMAEPTTRPMLSSSKVQAPVDAPAAPAAYNTSAASQPANAVTQADVADAFDSQLQRLLSSDTSSDPSLAALPPDEKQLLATVIDSLAAFRMSLRSGTGLMATRVAPLLALVDRIKAQTPLALPTLALCRSVTQFGVYDSVDPPRFTAGKDTPTIVYCEVENFTSAEQPDGRFETKLRYEAVLYSDGEHSAAVMGKKPTSIVDACRNRRRDFFLADRLTIPASLPVGKYILKVTVVDELANHVAERTVPIMIAPN